MSILDHTPVNMGVEPTKLPEDADLVALHIIQAAFHERDKRAEALSKSARTEYVYDLIEKNNKHAHQLVLDSQGKDTDQQFVSQVVSELARLLQHDKQSRKAWNEFKPAIQAHLRKQNLNGLADALDAKTLNVQSGLSKLATDFAGMFKKKHTHAEQAVVQPVAAQR